MGAAALAILGAEGLIFLRGLQGESDATAGIVIWTAMLSIYALALTRAPARGFAIGAAVAAAWLVATVVDPGVPTSTGPALLAIAFAAICARGRIAGLCAAASAALLIAVLIDGPLSLLSPWVANSAPPVYPPESVDRLVDSVGIWLVGMPDRRRARPRDPRDRSRERHIRGLTRRHPAGHEEAQHPRARRPGRRGGAAPPRSPATSHSPRSAWSVCRSW